LSYFARQVDWQFKAPNMKKLSLITALMAAALGGQAQSAFQLSLTPDVAIHPRTTRINGLTLNFWGENPQSALALGLVNGSTGTSEGFTWSFLVNYADDYTGVAWGAVNVSYQNFYGWQSGLVNYSQGTFTGLQSGWINVAQHLDGLQWGFVNYAEKLHGVQIGFVNVAENNPWFTEFPNKLAPAFPIVNWSF
jgi:hypothetical protein